MSTFRVALAQAELDPTELLASLAASLREVEEHTLPLSWK